MQATLDGSREIVFTIISMTISLAAVFIPVLFMGGILGRLLHEFAVTIMAAVLISGFVSLTLTPMMCSRILKPHRQGERHGRLYMAFERGFDAVRDAYQASLRFTLRHQRIALAAFLGICVATVVLFVREPKGFLPSEDAGQLLCFVEGPQDISFQAMVDLQRQVAEIIGRDPNVEHAMSSRSRSSRSRSASPPTRWCASCARKSPICSASRCSCRTFPRSASAASSPRARIST